jgi:transcriptional regulator with XRE-family HTH domain
MTAYLAKIPDSCLTGLSSVGCGDYPDGMDDLDLSEMLERLVTLIRRRGLTQEQAEAMAGLARNRISKWLGGQGQPRFLEMVRLSRQLNVPLEHFVTKEVGSEGSGDADLDFCFQTVRRLGTAEAMYRLLGDRRRPE